MTDIMDEKPNVIVKERDRYGVPLGYCYDERAMDAFLEKVKAELDKLEEVKKWLDDNISIALVGEEEIHKLNKILGAEE